MNQFQKVTTDYKSYPLSTQVSERSLGPGRYPTPQMPTGHKYTFPKSPRFGQDSLLHTLNSDPSIKPNQSAILQKLPKLVKETQEKSKEKYKERINRETKRIIDTEKREKLMKNLRDKVQKAEYRKNAKIKDMICKSFCIIFTHFCALRVLRDKFRKVSLRKESACLVLRKLVVLCKTLGKFLRIVRKVRKKTAIKRIKMLIPIRLKFWLNRHKKKLKMRLSYSFDKYLAVILIRMFKQKLIRACNLVQVKTKGFLKVLNARRMALDKFWIKLSKYMVLAPPHIRTYFINRYIVEKLKRHYYEKFKDKKLIFLLNERRHEEFIDEFYYEKGKSKPFLRFFIHSDMIELIRLANSSIGAWSTILAQKPRKRSKPKKRPKKKTTLKQSLTPSPPRPRKK